MEQEVAWVTQPPEEVPRAAKTDTGRLISLCAASLLVLLTVGCASVPLDTPKVATFAIEDASQTLAARRVNEWLGGRFGVNGFYPLTQGFDAFGARLALMDRAEVSIDVQSFLMKPDDAGLVFAAGLLGAAERGVRVRLLLDDIFTTVKDVDLAMLDDHPNIEVRIFNPISRNGFFVFNYLGNFKLTNRRMHNKAFIVDNQIAIVGGRNIAVEYFQLETTGEFIDFDMLSAGSVVRDVSAQFDMYWNHELAVPIDVLFTAELPKTIDEVVAILKREMLDAGDSIYADAIATPLMKQFYERSLPPYIAPARLLTDEPQKLLAEVSDEQQIVANELRGILLAAEDEIVIFTPYFIPRERGMALVRQLRAKGIRIVLVTNSLETNNHTAVHSHYSKYRKDLLKAGVELWEARADAAKIVAEDGETSLDRLTLHTKGILIDRKRIFVGSLNIDPRSIDINTEMGLLIESPEMARRLSSNAELIIPDFAYRLNLDENDRITWHATIDGEAVVETSEPQASIWRRISAFFQKIVPEKQL